MIQSSVMQSHNTDCRERQYQYIQMSQPYV
ncbi:hypothetical protein HNQ59_003914 [Chitinivorax tropicus]|uniref:Uncharacterized protein n=1 Tax=Chitinivorax tropicus TaxID=714531 RepID=A0A840MU31_9PROT|nr:hypothetical protein [Chitinivorax tropicus]